MTVAVPAGEPPPVEVTVPLTVTFPPPVAGLGVAVTANAQFTRLTSHHPACCSPNPQLVTSTQSANMARSTAAGHPADASILQEPQVRQGAAARGGMRGAPTTLDFTDPQTASRAPSHRQTCHIVKP